MLKLLKSWLKETTPNEAHVYVGIVLVPLFWALV